MTNYEMITKEFANDPVRFLLRHNLKYHCVFLRLDIHGDASERCRRYFCCDECIKDWLGEETDESINEQDDRKSIAMKKAKTGTYGNGSITPRTNAKGKTYYTVRYKGYCTTVNNYTKAQKRLEDLRERDRSGLRINKGECKNETDQQMD